MKGLGWCYLYWALSSLELRERTAANRMLIRCWLSVVSRNLLPSQLSRAFRVIRVAFDKRCSILYPYVHRDEDMAALSSAGAVKIETKVGIFFPTLAGAQYLDMILCFGIVRPKSTIVCFKFNMQCYTSSPSQDYQRQMLLIVPCWPLSPRRARESIHCAGAVVLLKALL